MHRIRVMALAGLAIFAFSAIVATTAQATEGPFYKTCAKKENPCAAPKRLGAGETLVPTSETTKTFVLEAAEAGVVLECTKQTLKEATLVGSAAGTAGSSVETIVFEGCTQKGDGAEPGCIVAGKTITTVPLVNTLDKENKVAKKGEKFLVSFRPKAGSIFVTVKFEGSTCKIKESAIELGAGAKLGVAGTADNEAQEAIKLEENETFGESGLIAFPTTLLKSEFVEEGKVVSEVKEKLTFIGVPVNRFEGHAKITVAKTSWGIFGK
jgi:hypothetical protein